MTKFRRLGVSPVRQTQMESSSALMCTLNMATSTNVTLHVGVVHFPTGKTVLG